METLVDDYYGADPTRVLLDLADRYGLAAAVLDRTWFTQFTRRDLTDDEWKRIAAELGDFSNSLQQSCATHLFDYACTVLDTAGVPLPDTTATELPLLPAAAREGQGPGSGITAHSPTPGDTPAVSQLPLVPDVQDTTRLHPDPDPYGPLPEQASSRGAIRALTLDEVDRLVPHSARVWNYILGGADHYEADRDAADTFQELYPDLAHLVVSQRGFKRQAIDYLARQGVRQFLDIGPGLPSPKDLTDTHTVAISAAPAARTVYVDNDPLVTIRIQELLNDNPGCGADLVHADVADTETVLAGAARHLDLSQPVALLLIGVMGHIDDTDDAHAVVRRLMDALAAGSYLALSDATPTRTALTWAQETYNGTGAAPYRLRGPNRIAEFFTGLTPVQPGLVPPELWRPGQPPTGPVNTDARCAVAKTV
ncbi:SAM-dependent methyltransferase [Actinomadura monticuli]|uniref:SAM-dependent methyltransferase n=1 Tax=Actinomadura monticuli TaxID=3097367 RepID=A0ABV4QMD3_9ACTN